MLSFAALRVSVARCLLAAALLASVQAGHAGAAEPKPWTLRGTYAFPYGNGTFEIDNELAEWRLLNGANVPLLTDTGFSIAFEDGAVWTQKDLGVASKSRDAIESPLGDGTLYAVHFPPKDGIVVHYELTRFSDRPFLLARIVIENKGEKPVRLSTIKPLVFQGDGNGLASEGVQYAVRELTYQGAFPVYGDLPQRQLAIFNVVKHDLRFALGLLPTGQSESTLEFTPANGHWQGAAVCDYKPGLNIEAGSQVVSDTVWIGYGIQSASDIDLYYSWSLSELNPQPESLPEIRAWVTVPEDGNLDGLVAQGNDWLAAGVRHALIPAGWESKPGSFEGASPRYPKRIQAAAKTLRDAGLEPGITIDPLLFWGRDKGYNAESADGLKWLNPLDPAAVEVIGGNVAELRQQGFAFIVLEPSRIPDDALKSFNATRSAANCAAINAVLKAAGDMAVYPQARRAALHTCDEWLEASAAVSRMARFGVNVGPLPLDANSLKKPSEDLVAALRIWPGPLEIQGKSPGSVQKACGEIFGRSAMAALPVDAGTQSPRLWQLSHTRGEMGYVGSAILAFQGQGTHLLSDVVLEQKTPHRFWRSNDGSELKLSEQLSSNQTAPLIIGASPVMDHPVLLGISSDSSLYLDRIANLSWNEQEGELSGKIEGPINEGAIAYVFVPASWQLTSGKVGSSSVKKAVNGNTLALPIEAGGATFDLQFKRQS
ncbi:MAG: hypothetical protein HYV27_20160 [Candidatus Hydrogenedentes bacterium]|nr:hypothetical protein [Candidatus Hydrogenedentota bacterium]